MSVLTRTGEGLAPFLAAVREQLAAAPVAHFDETSLRVAAAGAWVHSASTETLSLFHVDASMMDDREQTVSSKFEGVLWDRVTNRTGWSAILGDTCGGPDVSPYAAAARATDLSGLPPAYLETGSSEVFRDEIIDYAARLAQAGVPMELHSWAGGFHGFELVAPDAEVSRVTLATRTSYLKRALASVKTAAAIPPA